MTYFSLFSLSFYEKNPGVHNDLRYSEQKIPLFETLSSVLHNCPATVTLVTKFC